MWGIDRSASCLLWLQLEPMSLKPLWLDPLCFCLIKLDLISFELIRLNLLLHLSNQLQNAAHPLLQY